jgi:hypothetical protein
VGPDGQAEGEGLAAARLEQAGQNPQGRGLAGAVGADQADHLALAGFEVEAADRLGVAVAHLEAAEAEEGAFAHPSLPAAGAPK